MDKNFRIKMSENFKDGNVLGGKFLKVGDVLVVSERDATLIESSGGLFEILEQVIPNPLKRIEEAPVESNPQELSSYNAEVPATGEAKPGQTVSKPRRGNKRK